VVLAAAAAVGFAFSGAERTRVDCLDPEDDEAGVISLPAALASAVPSTFSPAPLDCLASEERAEDLAEVYFGEAGERTREANRLAEDASDAAGEIAE
jgi:hypothetical protein